VKDEENSGKIKNSTTGEDRAVKENDGLIVKEDEIETREAQQQKCENAMPTDNMTPNDDSNGEKQHQRHEQDLDRINQCQCAHVIRDNADNNVIPSQRRQQCNSEPTTTTHEELPPKAEKLQQANESDNKVRKYDEDDNDDRNMNDDNNKKERERELCEQKRKEIRNQFRRILDEDDPYKDDSGISTNEYFQLDAEYDVLLEIKQHKKAIRDNDDKDFVDVGSSAPGNNDVDDDNDKDSNRNNNNHEEQEESDATQQYPKSTREQVINDKYILEQQKAAFHQVMEIELQVEKEIQTQEVVDKDTVVVCSSANDDGDHVNKKQQQEIAKKQQRNNWNKAKKNHNVIEYMNYTNISTVQSNEIQYPTF